MSVLRMFASVPMTVCTALFTLGACADEVDTSSAELAVQEPDEGVSNEPGEMNPNWSDEEYGPETEGERGPARPADPEYVAKINAYFTALNAMTTIWTAQGLSQSEIDGFGSELRAEMMGERP